MKTFEQQIQAKKDALNRLIEKQKKQENQNKIIVGALILSACKDDNNLASKIYDVIVDNASERDKKKLSDILSELKKQKEVKESNFTNI